MIRWPFLSRHAYNAAIRVREDLLAYRSEIIGHRDVTIARLEREVESLKAAVLREQSVAKYQAHLVELATAELAQFRASRDRQLANLRLGTAASAAKRKGVAS